MQQAIGIFCVVIWMIMVIQELLFWIRAIKVPGTVVSSYDTRTERNGRPSPVNILLLIPAYQKIVAYTYEGENKQVTSDWASWSEPTIGQKWW